VRKGWSNRRIGDVLKLEYGKPLSQEHRVIDGHYPVYGANGVKYYSDLCYKGGPSIIVGRKGSAGEINLVTEDFWPLDVTYFVVFDGEKYELKYLFYLLSSLNLPSLAKGVKPGINRNDVYSLNSWFPPLPEQKRIVEILDEAFAAIDKATANTEKNIKNAEEVYQSKLNFLFENNNSDWIETKLENLIHIKHGFAFKSAGFSKRGKHVLLTPGNFYEHGGFRERGNKQKFYVGDFPKAFVLRKGDLLLAMTEQAAGLLGSPLIVPESARFLHNQRLGLVQPKSDAAWCSEFFFYAFNSRKFRRAVHESASGTKVRHTSPKKICNVMVRHPESVNSQKSYANFFCNLHDQSLSMRIAFAEKLSCFSQLKTSILHKAFTGELTSDFKAVDKALSEAGV